MLNRSSVFTRITETFLSPSAVAPLPEVEGKVEESSQIQTSQVTPTRSVNTSDEIKGKVETKIISLWHNMKYGWSGKLKSNFNKDSAIWVLGRCYHQKMTPCPSMETSVEMSNILTGNENKMMTLSMHEEQPTSSESYLNAQTPTSDDEQIDRAIEPAEETGQDVAGNYEDGIEGFKKDFISRIWMTYRKDFALMPFEPANATSGGFTSDCGWGCMIRSGQMLLAQALVMHFLGRSWRFDPDSQIFSTAEDHIHRRIIRWFGDQISKNSPFSIHALVELGKESGKKVGEWYSPGQIAHLMKQAVKQSARENLDLASLHVYVAQDCTIYNQDIFDECYSQESHPVPWKLQNSHSSPARNRREIITWKSLILLIPLRLGHEKLNPIYGDCLKAMLSLEWCIGIIGGRPKHSLYFVGYQDDKLIHLDPHYCQDLNDVNQENFSLANFHCKSPRKMKISKMDPSCCLGFYISSRNDYDRFQSSVQPYLLPVKNFSEKQNGQSCVAPQKSFGLEYNYPMFVFNAGRLKDQNMGVFINRNNIPSPGVHSRTLSDDDDDDGIEDFVIV